MKRIMITWLLIVAKLPKLIVFLKVAKLGKVFALFGGMAVSAIAYGAAFNSWALGVGLVVLLLVHEVGHVIAARLRGVVTSWPMFIPFLGAAIFIKSMGSLRSEAIIGIGGPLLGTLGALALLVPLAMQDDNFWRALVYLGLTLNAFNMIPLRPLDGGRITAICGSWFRIGGFVILGVLSVVVHEPVMLYVWILVLSDVSLPLWWRPRVATILLVTMIALMTAGYSAQHYIADSADSLFASGVTFYYWVTDRAIAAGEPDPMPPTHYDDEDSVSSRERITWAAAWGLLLALLIGGMLLVGAPLRS